MRAWKQRLDALEEQHEQLTLGVGVRTAFAFLRDGTRTCRGDKSPYMLKAVTVMRKKLRGVLQMV